MIEPRLHRTHARCGRAHDASVRTASSAVRERAFIGRLPSARGARRGILLEVGLMRRQAQGARRCRWGQGRCTLTSRARLQGGTSMESRKMSLCPMCTNCPEVVIDGDQVRIGEDANTAVLKKDEWNVLVD